jgi:hypothetical protein
MLPRRLINTLSRRATPLTENHNHVCTCSCGALVSGHGFQLLPPNPTIQQRRNARTPRQAPATRKKLDRLEGGFALTPEQVKRRQEQRELERGYFYQFFSEQYRQGVTSTPPEIVVDFMKALAQMDAKSRKLELDIPTFLDAVHASGMGDRDLYLLSWVMLHAFDDVGKALGRRLMFTLSAAGYEDATIRILLNAVLGNKERKNLVKAASIQKARRHLRQLAERGTSHRALVLEGKIAYALGDKDYAIECWDRSMDLAIAAAEAEAQLKERARVSQDARKEMSMMARMAYQELSSPWVDLTNVHYERYVEFRGRADKDVGATYGELHKAKEACEIGCKVDDPTSHYHMAEYFNNPGTEGPYTSTWLYHLTKAAATGHIRACHRLANWYVESVWPYLDDEPPDTIKPTAFDTYPGPSESKSGVTSFFKDFQDLFRPQMPETSDPRLSLFHTGTFPGTPHGRWLLSFQWLRMPLAHAYAPSFLLAAKMHLEEKFWGQAYVPQSAWSFSDKRYLYASKEDYDSKTEIPGRREELNAELNLTPDEPNPYYNPDEAKQYILRVFQACEALRLRVRLIQNKLAKQRRGASAAALAKAAQEQAAEGEDLEVQQKELPQDLPQVTRIVLSSPDVREMWEEQAQELESEAKRICEEREWDVVDEKGGLIYKHGLGKGR